MNQLVTFFIRMHDVRLIGLEKRVVYVSMLWTRKTLLSVIQETVFRLALELSLLQKHCISTMVGEIAVKRLFFLT